MEAYSKRNAASGSMPVSRFSHGSPPVTNFAFLRGTTPLNSTGVENPPYGSFIAHEPCAEINVTLQICKVSVRTCKRQKISADR